MFEMSMQWCLVHSALLAFVMVLFAGMGKVKFWTPAGLMFLAGNRGEAPEVQPWMGRADRAARNMMESLLFFVALVATAQGMGVSNEATSLGASIFFWARLAYFPIYVAGIAWVRTGVWALGVAGMGIILVELA